MIFITRQYHQVGLFVVYLTTLISGTNGQITFFGQDLNPNFETDNDGPFPNSVNAKDNFFSQLKDPVTESFEQYDVRSDYTILTQSTERVSEIALRTNVGETFGIENINGLAVGRYPIHGQKYLDAKAKIGGFYITFNVPIAALGFFGIDIGDFDGTFSLETTLGGNQKKIYEIESTETRVYRELDGSVLYFGLIDREEFDRIDFVTNENALDIFAFDNFTIDTLDQLSATCKNETLVVDGNCEAETPSPEYLYSIAGADIEEFSGLPNPLTVGIYTYKITASYPVGIRGEVEDSCTGTITVVDETAPVVTCIRYRNNVDETCLAEVPIIGEASDNCEIRSQTQNPPAGTALPQGEYPVDVMVTDTSGNTGSCTGVYEVEYSDCGNGGKGRGGKGGKGGKGRGGKKGGKGNRGGNSGKSVNFGAKGGGGKSSKGNGYRFGNSSKGNGKIGGKNSSKGYYGAKNNGKFGKNGSKGYGGKFGKINANSKGFGTLKYGKSSYGKSNRNGGKNNYQRGGKRTGRGEGKGRGRNGKRALRGK